MQFYDNAYLRIYFGDQSTALSLEYLYSVKDSAELMQQPQLKQVISTLGLNGLSILKQVHGACGYVITGKEGICQLEGDYLITSIPGIGLAVTTADCLPIVLYDTEHQVVGIAHAGWRGSLQQIAVRMLEDLQKKFGTQPEQVQAFFGPSAQVCCYQVSTDFKHSFDRYDWAQEAFSTRTGALYFDMLLFNQVQLEQVGVNRASCIVDFARCAICSPELCSNRREGLLARRQLTIVALV